MLDRRLIHITLFLLLCAELVSVSAQEPVPGLDPITNMLAYQMMAGNCILPPTETLDALSLDADSRMPYLVSYLFEQWSAADQTVQLADSTRREGPLLRYRVNRASVAYRRMNRRMVERTVALALEVRLVDGADILLHDVLCQKTRTDALDREHVAALSNAGYPETQAPIPAGSLFRRYAEPAALAVAMGAVVYLFFSVRSAGE